MLYESGVKKNDFIRDVACVRRYVNQEGSGIVAEERQGACIFAVMQKRKIGATKIFDGHRFWENAVLIVDSDGCIEALVQETEAGENIERYEGILSPGFVNCHCHLELSHMKGKIPEKTGLVDFVFKVVTERSAGEEEILQAIADAETEMKNAGIVAVGDICNNTLTLPQKQRANLHYYNFIEASGWLPAVSGARFERARMIYDSFVNAQEETANTGRSATPNPKPQTPNCSIVPHAPYSVSEHLWELIQPYFKDKVVSIHNQETKFEDEFFLQGTGDFQRMYELMKMDNSHHRPTRKSSLQSYFQKLSSAKNIILVHNTFTKEADVDFAKRQWPVKNDEPSATQLQTPNPQPRTFFCLCVNANLYIEDVLPPIEMLREKGCNIVLGTDSLASNRSLNLVDEIKTIRRIFPQIPLEEILGWATINGAKALGMDGFLGRFEKGTRPGVVLFEPEQIKVSKVLF